MPIYEYRCSECGQEFEKWLRSMSTQDNVCCPSCGSQRVNKAVSIFGRGGASLGGTVSDSSCAPTGG